MRNRFGVVTLLLAVAAMCVWVSGPQVETAEAGGIIAGPINPIAIEPIPIDPIPYPHPCKVCYAFHTIDQGQMSGFGDCYPGSWVEGETLGNGCIDPVDPFAHPCYLPVAKPRFEVIIRHQCMWEDFWEKHTSNMDPSPPLPDVNFERDVVIAVIAGWGGHGCKPIEVAAIAPGCCCPYPIPYPYPVDDVSAIVKPIHWCCGCNTTIHVRQGVCCPGEPCCLCITNPYHIVKVCKRFLPFEKPTCFSRKLCAIPKCTCWIDCVWDDDTIDEIMWCEEEPIPGLIE
ncbi:MAG: hypothetical protein KAV82_12275 [Phycisphaerae bacterium]|nr:hypothetical protein [Phycisphaerae bacterium]